MTIATIDAVSPELVRGRGGGGPSAKRTVVGYGFWIFLLSDIIMFSALFAAYAVLSGQPAGGPTGRELFNLHNVFIETLCLLFSSYTAGLGALSAERQQRDRFLVFAALTFGLGAAFLFIEISEFAGMLSKGAMLTLAAALIWSGNARTALSDLQHGRPQAYRRANQEREQAILRARAAGQADVVLDPLPVIPSLFFQEDILPEDRRDEYAFLYLNDHMRMYYKVKNIYRTPGPAPSSSEHKEVP